MLHRISLIALFATIATPGFSQTNTLEEWRKQISIQLMSNKRFPREAISAIGTAKVVFVLDRQGQLISHQLLESSGNRAFDEESLAIVDRSGPFPIPPLGLETRYLRMTVPFSFLPSRRGRDTSLP